MACTYQDYDFDHGTLYLAEPSDSQALVTVAKDVQPQAQHGFPYVPEPYFHSPEQTSPAHEQHGMTIVAACQISAQEAAYRVKQMRMLPVSSRISHERLAYINPYESLPTQLACQQPQQHQQQQPGSECRMPMAPHNYHDSMRSQAYTYNSHLASPHSPSTHLGLPTQGHHHHRLSNHHTPSKLCRIRYGDSFYNAEEHSSLSVVGQPGMPPPAGKPKGPKHKFTPADDTLLLELKETKGLMWKQIESFFPGRSSGTLQVRYCTKLKAKSTAWTEDMVSLHSLSGNEENLLTLSRRSNASARPSKHTSMTAGVLYLGLWAKAPPQPTAKKNLTSCAADVARV
jgi:hypothetical protein